MTDQEVISLVPRPVVPCQCDGEYPEYTTRYYSLLFKRRERWFPLRIDSYIQLLSNALLL